MPVGIASRFCDTGTDLIQVGVTHAKIRLRDISNFILLIVVLALANLAAADQIVLKNGDRLPGTIVKSDGKTLVLKSDLVGEVAIALDNIANVTADKPLYVTLTDGRTVSGLVTAKNSQFEIKSNNGAVVVERSAIAIVRSEAEQRAYESTLNPGWFEQWSGGADLGFALTRGSSHTTNVALGMAISRETLRDKTSLYAASIYNRENTSGISRTVANTFRFGARYDRATANGAGAQQWAYWGGDNQKFKLTAVGGRGGCNVTDPLTSNFSGTAELRTTHVSAAGPFTSDINLTVKFYDCRAGISITDFPAITNAFNTLAGPNTSKLGMTGGGSGSFNSSNGQLVIPITLRLENSNLLFGNSTLSLSLAAEGNADSKNAVSGSVTLRGTGTFVGGALHGSQGTLVVTGTFSPRPR